MGATTLPVAVVYLLLVFIESLGSGGDLTADYLQDGVPSGTVSVSRSASGDPGLYRLTAVGNRDGSLSVYRIEASDLVGHAYLVLPPDSSFPFVLNLAPVLEQFTGVNASADRSLEVPGDTSLASPGVELSLGSVAYLIHRPDVTVVSSPETGIVLLIVEDR